MAGNPGSSRYFLLRGDPGSGKSAISARLCQSSQGLVPPPDDLAALGPGFLAANHFCSALKGGRVDPFRFAGSLASQLASRFPAYHQILLQQREEEQGRNRDIRIEVHQEIRQAIGTQVTGVVINVSGASPEQGYRRVVWEPLQALAKVYPHEQVVLLVNAHDESLIYSGKVGIVGLLARLEDLSKQVRVLMTSRHDDGVESQLLGAAGISISSQEYRNANRVDIEEYIHDRLRNDAALTLQAADLSPGQLNHRTQAIVDVARSARVE